jgi:hypothetical protein
MTTHSAEIIAEDLYVSDGSDDDLPADDGGTEASALPGEPEVVLANSRMGLMRRGLHHQSILIQPNRQWQRADAPDDAEQENQNDEESKRVEEELAKLDPAQRAARLLAEKQRKLEEAKETARRLESEENAGRDPCLFSKRTAFDIRMDQIEDKPWLRGVGDLTDFFNYGFTEDDWLEYSQQQLMIRQELMDASRQKRPPDPNIVPVAQRAPKMQNPRVAVANSSKTDDIDEDDKDGESGGGAAFGPVKVKPEITSDLMDTDEPTAADDKRTEDVKFDDSGGAWGAGAAPGSMLARLIEEQERAGEQQPGPEGAMAQDDRTGIAERYEADDAGSQDGSQRSDRRSRRSHDRGDGYDPYGAAGYHDYEDFQRSGRPPPPPHFGGRGYGGRGPPAPPYFYGGRGRGGPRYPPPPPPPPPPHGWGPPRKRHRDDYRR